MALRIRDVAFAPDNIDLGQTDATMHERFAGGADAAKIAGNQGNGDVVEHVGRRALWRTTAQAVHFAMSARLLGLIATPCEELAQFASENQMWPPLCKGGKARLQPIADRLLMDAVEPRNFLDGVAAVHLGAPRIKAALSSHWLPCAFLDEFLDVLNSPSRDAPTKLHGPWVSAIFDTSPPCGLADRNGAQRGKDMLEPEEAGLGKCRLLRHGAPPFE